MTIDRLNPTTKERVREARNLKGVVVKENQLKEGGVSSGAWKMYGHEVDLDTGTVKRDKGLQCLSNSLDNHDFLYALPLFSNAGNRDLQRCKV